MAIVEIKRFGKVIKSYDDKDFFMHNGHLCYQGTSLKPIQPVGFTDYSFMFAYRFDLWTIDLSDWDMSKVRKTDRMFYCCDRLIDISSLANWDMSNVRSMKLMFFKCAINDLSPLVDWDVSNVFDFYGMFNNCPDISREDKAELIWNHWNTDIVTFLVLKLHSFYEILEMTKWALIYIIYCVIVPEKKEDK